MKQHQSAQLRVQNLAHKTEQPPVTAGRAKGWLGGRPGARHHKDSAGLWGRLVQLATQVKQQSLIPLPNSATRLWGSAADRQMQHVNFSKMLIHT